MEHAIKRDHARFRRIVRNKIKQNLRKYISHSDTIIPKGTKTFRVPMPFIDIPHYKFGSPGQGGVGQGKGQPSDPVDGEQENDGQAGQGEGTKELEVELTMEELAQILGEELELPNIQPKGKKQLRAAKDRYTTIGLVGPSSLKHFKRTYKEALKSLDWSNNTGYFFETIYEQVGQKFLFKEVPEILGIHF